MFTVTLYCYKIFSDPSPEWISSNASLPSTSGTLVRPEEVGIVMVVMLIWLWACVLFYIRYSGQYSLQVHVIIPTRWSKFSRLESYPPYYAQTVPEEGQSLQESRWTCRVLKWLHQHYPSQAGPVHDRGKASLQLKWNTIQQFPRLGTNLSCKTVQWISKTKSVLSQHESKSIFLQKTIHLPHLPPPFPLLGDGAATAVPQVQLHVQAGNTFTLAGDGGV